MAYFLLLLARILYPRFLGRRALTGPRPLPLPLLLSRAGLAPLGLPELPPLEVGGGHVGADSLEGGEPPALRGEIVGSDGAALPDVDNPPPSRHLSGPQLGAAERENSHLGDLEFILKIIRSSAKCWPRTDQHRELVQE